MSKSNQTENNHYLSRFFSNNFRVTKGNPLWLLDCATGTVTSRKTNEKHLFMKKEAWGQSLEDAFNHKLENDIKPLLDSILAAPYKPLPANANIGVEVLSERYNRIFSYTLQTIMLQMSNRDEHDKKISDEAKVERFLEIPFKPTCEHPYLIRYNRTAFKDLPLVLIDNAASIFATPPVESSLGEAEYSICHIMPISPYYLIFWGTLMQLEFFINSKPNPHTVNLYRILSEEKQCQATSQNKKYLRWLAKEYPHYANRSGVAPISMRKYN